MFIVHFDSKQQQRQSFLSTQILSSGSIKQASDLKVVVVFSLSLELNSEVTYQHNIHNGVVGFERLIQVFKASFYFFLNVGIKLGKASCRKLMMEQAHCWKINTVNNFLFLHCYLSNCSMNTFQSQAVNLPVTFMLFL